MPPTCPPGLGQRSGAAAVRLALGALPGQHHGALGELKEGTPSWLTFCGACSACGTLAGAVTIGACLAGIHLLTCWCCVCPVWLCGHMLYGALGCGACKGQPG